MTFQNRSTRRHPLTRIAAAGALALAALGSLQGCVLLLGAGAVGGGLVFTDRRTSGTQLDDQSIELIGDACAKFLLGTGSLLSAKFPCAVFTPS